MELRILARDQRPRRAPGDNPVTLPGLGPAYEVPLARSATRGEVLK